MPVALISGMTKLTHLSALLFATTCLTAACVEPTDDSGTDEDQGETDKNGAGSMSLREADVEKTFTCSEIWSCDIDIRASRCGGGAPTGRVLGELTMINEAGEELVVAEVTDSPYVWLIGTAAYPGAYSHRIETLSPRETFTLSFKAAPAPLPPPPPPPGSNLPPAPPLLPACINLTVAWS